MAQNMYTIHSVTSRLNYCILFCWALLTLYPSSIESPEFYCTSQFLLSEHCATDTEFHCTSYSQSTVPFTQNSTAHLILRALWHLHRIPLHIIFSEYSAIYTEFHCASYSQSTVPFTQNSPAHHILRVLCHVHRIPLHIQTHKTNKQTKTHKNTDD